MPKTFSFVAFSALLFLQGCGLTPLYMEGSDNAHKDIAHDLALIKIEGLPDREGQILHNHLLDKINPGGEPSEPKAYLSTSLELSKVTVSIRRDGTTQRFNVVAVANILLRDQNKKIVYSDTVRRLTSYSVGDATAELGYASTVSEKDAKHRSLLLLADDIHLMLATYYKKWGGEKATKDLPQTHLRGLTTNACS